MEINQKTMNKYSLVTSLKNEVKDPFQPTVIKNYC